MGKAELPGPCQVCGESAHEHVITHEGGRFYRCPSCRLVFMHPMPTADEIVDMYSRSESAGTSVYFEKIESKMRRARGRVTQIVRRLGHAPAGRSFLDVGCSGGFTVEAARESGFRAHGIDLDAEAIAWARQHYPANAYSVVRVEKFQPEGGGFDVVYCSEVIEHVPDVNCFVAALARVIAPGGLLYLTTPDIGHWRRPRNLLKWDVFTPPRHCIFFSAGNLKRLLARHGLEIRSRRVAFKPGLKVFAERVA